MKGRVHFQAMASISVKVEVPDGLDDEEARELAIEKAYELLPGSVCAHCSGWGKDWSRDEGEYEALDDGPVEWEDAP